MKFFQQSIAPLLFLLCMNQLLFSNVNNNEAPLINSGQEEQFRALIRLSVDHWKSAPASSIIYGEEALEIAQKVNNERMEAEALNNIGVAYSYANAFGDALDFFFKALVIREKLDDENLLATTLNNIGNVYFISGNRDQAISYYLQSLQIKEESENNKQITSTLINLASLYNSQGQTENAITHINRAIVLLEAEADSSGLSTAWNNLSKIYLQMGDHERALEVNQKALTISEQLNKSWDIAYVSNSIGEIYLDKMDLENAFTYITKGQNAAIKLQNRDVALYNLRLLAIYHSYAGNKEEFLEAFQKHNHLKDSIFSEENSRAIAEMQVIYKTEQREKENAIQKLQLAKERSIRNTFIFLSIIVLILIGIIYRRYQIKRNLNKKLEDQVKMRTADLVSSHQKITQLNESLLINTIDTEERERRRFSEDLHDGLGPLLSTIRIHLELIQARQSQQSEQNELIRTASDLLDDAISSTRDIANNLTPNILRDFGMQEALKGYIQKINSIGAMQIDFLANGPDERYPSHVELALYRICLELINNSLKHSTASHVKISISGDEHNLKFKYCDNGIGFNANEGLPVNDKGLGLSNIISRIKSINGKYSIKSQKGKGFELEMNAVYNTDLQETTA